MPFPVASLGDFSLSGQLRTARFWAWVESFCGPSRSSRDLHGSPCQLLRTLRPAWRDLRAPSARDRATGRPGDRRSYANYDGCQVAFHFVFPVAQDRPAKRAKRVLHLPITLLVTRNLLRLERCVGGRGLAVVLATVPKTAVHKHRDLAADEGQIRPPRNTWTYPVTQSDTPERAAQDHLRPCVRHADACHLFRLGQRVESTFFLPLHRIDLGLESGAVSVNYLYIYVTLG